MPGFRFSAAGFFCLWSLTGAAAAAEIFTTDGSDTRFSADKTIGNVYGQIGEVRYYVQSAGADNKPSLYEHAGGRAFLVSPCHALTNARVMTPKLTDAKGGPSAIEYFELRFGPPTDGRTYRDATPMRIIQTGKSGDNRNGGGPPGAAIGLSPHLQRSLAAGAVFRRSNDWALLELNSCLGDIYGYFQIDASGAAAVADTGKTLEVAGYSRGHDGEVIADNCRDMGPEIAAAKPSRWSYSHQAVRLFDCSSRPDNSGGPVYYYNAMGAAQLIGIETSSGASALDAKDDQPDLQIPREYAHEYFYAWQSQARKPGYIDIRQALLSPRVMKLIRPYQPGLRAFDDRARPRHYQEASFRLYDGQSPEHLQTSARAQLPEGFLFLRLAHLNRLFGNLDDATRLERAAKARLKNGGWRSALNDNGAFSDPAIAAESLTLVINAKELFNIDRVARFRHRGRRLEWSLRAGNLALAREDLQAIEAMEAASPVDPNSAKEVRRFERLAQLFSGDSDGANNSAAEDANKFGNDDLNRLLDRHGMDAPQIVARALQKTLRESPADAGPLVLYTLNSVRFVARSDDYDRFRQFRLGRFMRAIGYWKAPSAELLARGDPLEAITSANIERALDADDLNALYIKAQAQLMAGFIGASIATYSELIEHLSDLRSNRSYTLTAAVYFQRGDAYDRLGKSELAIADFKKARALVPGDLAYSR